MRKLFDEMPRLENERLLLRELEDGDAKALRDLTSNVMVYRYLPVFLYEQKYEDPHVVIRRMREECFLTKESLILGIFLREGMEFCGLAEFYGYKKAIHKACIGYRLNERYWGRGIASQVVAMMIDYLYSKTDVEIITASTMIENVASERVLMNNGFIRTASSVPEDWGRESITVVNKWFR